jgi:S1-C subfamily serine protease
LKYVTKIISCLFYVPAVLSIILLHSASALSEDISGTSSFMDMESSVKDLRERIDKTFPSIVMIIVYDITGEESARGSGFFYDTEGRIITNASILKNAYSAEVISNKNRYSIISILNYDETIDTAVIKVNAVNEIPLEIDFENNLTIDEKVIAMGRNDNFGQTLSEGLIKSIVPLDENRVLIRGITLRPVLSLPPSDDGPLLNSEGAVIGLTSYQISDSAVMSNKTILFDGQSINAISISSITGLTESLDTLTLLHPKGSRVWWHWFKYRIKTVFVSAFIFLYTLGFTKMISYLFMITVVLSIAQFIFNRIKKKFFKQHT